MKPSGAGQPGIEGGVEAARAGAAQGRAGLFEAQIAGEAFRADAGPAGEHPLEMERAEMHRRGDLVERRRVITVRRDMGDGRLDPAVVALRLRGPGAESRPVSGPESRAEPGAESEATGAGVPDGLAVSLGWGCGRSWGVFLGCLLPAGTARPDDHQTSRRQPWPRPVSCGVSSVSPRHMAPAHGRVESHVESHVGGDRLTRSRLRLRATNILDLKLIFNH